jgi:hypothetical protein
VNPVSVRRLLHSVILAAAINVLRFFPPLADAMDDFAEIVAATFHITRWVAHIGLFTAASGAFYLILQTGAGIWFLDKVVRVLGVLLIAVRWATRKRKVVFSVEERDGREFRNDIKRSVTTSPIMYCLLLAGTTLVYGEERFLLRELEKLRHDVLMSKDIRILLLDPNCPDWTIRAGLVIKERSRFTLQNYLAYCEVGLSQLQSALPNAKIERYNSRPIWRIYLFKDRAFVSRYMSPPDSMFRLGYDSPVMAFGPGEPMFDWLYAEFRRHSPPPWQNDLPVVLPRET